MQKGTIKKAKLFTSETARRIRLEQEAKRKAEQLERNAAPSFNPNFKRLVEKKAIHRPVYEAPGCVIRSLLDEEILA